MPWAVPLPRVLAPGVQHVATASFWIYLTHWQCYPAIEASGHRVLAAAASIGVGLVACRVWAVVAAGALAGVRSFDQAGLSRYRPPSPSPSPRRAGGSRGA